MNRRHGPTIGLARDTRPTAIGAFISADMTLPGIPLPLDTGTPAAEPEERWTLGGRPAADETTPDAPPEPVPGSGRHRREHGR